METNDVRLAVESGDSIGDESCTRPWLAQGNDDGLTTNIAEDGLVSVVEPEPHELLAVLNPLPKITVHRRIQISITPAGYTTTIVKRYFLF